MLSEQDLIAYLEHTLSPAERKRVESELERDPQSRHELLRQLQLDAAMRTALGAEAANQRVRQSVLAVVRGGREEALKNQILAHTTAPQPPPSVWEWMAGWARRPAFGLSLAAALVLFVLWFAHRPATLSTDVELPSRVEVAGVSRQPRSGASIRADTTRSATVKFADGTILHLEPGTEIALQPVANPPRQGGKQLKLLAGSLSADVAKQPEGLPLLIQTPHALITVVGTEFDLNVATNQTELEVTRGLVKMTGNGKTSTASVAAGEYAVAAPRAPLRYGRLARNPYLWPFSSASIWNRPLGNDAKFAPVPGKSFLAEGPLPDAIRSRRPFIGAPGDPLRRVWLNDEARADIRLADANLPGTRLVDSLVLLQQGRRYALELRGVTVRPDGDLDAQAIARTDLAGPGADDSANGAKPFGFSNLGGLLRAGELANGVRHALSARVSRERLGGRNDFQTPSVIWPATGGDAASAEFLNVGTLLAIPPNVDIAAKFGTNGPAFELARAMQDYGIYVTGFIDAPFVLLADANGSPDLNAVLSRLIPELRVVENNSPTPGGAPRRAPAPALP